MDITLSIITINYNGFKDTSELIETLPLEDDTIEVIVVDNASKEDEATIIEQRYPQVQVIRSNKNLGFAGGNNLGIKAARGKFLFFINNDTVFRPHTLDFRLLTNRLESSEKIGIVCPKIRNEAIGCGESDHGQYDTAHPTPYAHGAAMMVKREVIEKAGLMPECYFLYYEELDWSMMIRRAGYDIWYEPAVTIYHKESQPTGQNSTLKSYYMTRNRLLFVRRNDASFSRYLSYFYLICMVACRDLLKYSLQRRFDLAKASLFGVRDFISLNSKR